MLLLLNPARPPSPGTGFRSEVGLVKAAVAESPLGRPTRLCGFRPLQGACRAGFSPFFYRVHSLGFRPSLVIVAVAPSASFSQARPIGSTACRSTPHRQVACICGLLVLTTEPKGLCQVCQLTALPGASRASSTWIPTQGWSCGRHCVTAYHVTTGFSSFPRRQLGRVKSSI